MRKPPLLLLLAVGLCVVLGLAYPEQTRARWRQLLEAGRPLVPGQGAAAVHKCLRGEAVHYSTEPCPAGSRDVPMTGGTVNVMPATPTPTAASAPASRPNVRDLLAPPGEVDLQQRRIDQATR